MYTLMLNEFGGLRRGILLLLVYVQLTEGLKCWTCDGKRSLSECYAQYGKMLECQNPDDVCQNDYRFRAGLPLLIKGCKQEQACLNEEKEHKNQCGRGKNNACRCCCKTNGCNRKVSGCVPPPAPCKKPRAPINGLVFCDRELNFGAKCRYRCIFGYEREGPPTSTCVKNPDKPKKGLWSPEPPICKRVFIECLPPRTNPQNGFVRCENSREFARYKRFTFEGTRCVYSCKQNYYLKGKKLSQCRSNGLWSNDIQPTCVIGRCRIPVPDENRINICTSGFKFGSSCRFKCKPGYRLVGKDFSDCNQFGRSERGFWSQGLPRCDKIKCSNLDDPEKGKVSCPNGTDLESVCQYRCNKGYDLDDTIQKIVLTTCQYVDVEEGSVDWSRKPPPTCSRIRCNPPFQNPKNGKVKCTNKNWLDSVCRFSCDKNHVAPYDTAGSLKSVCQDDGDNDKFGEWSMKMAFDCKPVTCETNTIKLINSIVTCTQGNSVGSTCKIECLRGYAFEGSQVGVINTTCRSTNSMSYKGSWTLIPPQCSIIKCPPLPPVEHGTTKCSNKDYIIGTKCKFACNKNYRMIGKAQTSCRDIEKDGDTTGEWTNPPPKCSLGKCPPILFDDRTVVRDCTAPEGYDVLEFRVGTQCRYTCKDDSYYMLNEFTNEPILRDEVLASCTDRRLWSNPAPRCIKKICLPVPKALTNGYFPKCTNGNIIGSTCVFRCKEKYELTQPRPIKCIADDDNDAYGTWDGELPTCKRSHCDDFGMVKHGTLNCTEGSRIGSVCQLTCKDRYTTKQYETTACLDTIDWSSRQFFCCVRCLFNKRIRVLGVYDSSAFRTKLDWEYMVDFTESYLSYMVRYGFDIEFSAFNYAKDVDTSNLIKMKKLRDREDVSEVSADLEYMCDKECLKDNAAYTGRALRYIDEEVFPEVEKRREHFVILRTTGRSRDQTAAIAKKLREKNINILVIGIQSKKDSEAQLLQIAGKERNYLAVRKPQDLRNVPAKIFEISRETGCTAASKTQNCS
ncbi:P-selectin-like [Styela clava]